MLIISNLLRDLSGHCIWLTQTSCWNAFISIPMAVKSLGYGFNPTCLDGRSTWSVCDNTCSSAIKLACDLAIFPSGIEYIVSRLLFQLRWSPCEVWCHINRTMTLKFPVLVRHQVLTSFHSKSSWIILLDAAYLQTTAEYRQDRVNVVHNQ